MTNNNNNDDDDNEFTYLFNGQSIDGNKPGTWRAGSQG